METTCIIVMTSIFGGGSFIACCCLHFVCDSPIPNRITPRVDIYKPRYGDPVNTPPEYQEIAEQEIAEQEIAKQEIAYQHLVPPPLYKEID
jgi:hypothetical protein